MEQLQALLSFIQGQSLSDILLAVLAVIGGLKVIARYTPFEADDKILEAIEKPVLFVAGLLGKKK